MSKAETAANLKGSSATSIQIFSRAILNSVEEGVLAVNSSGLILMANRAARERLGIAPGYAVPERLPVLWIQVSGALRDYKGRTGVGLRIGESDFLCRINPVRNDGGLLGAVIIFSEVSELGKMAHQIQAFQELTSELDTIIESSSDGLWISDAEANVIRINRASERLNNTTARLVVGRNMKDLVEQGFIDQSASLEVIRTGKVVNLLQQRGERKLILTGTPVKDAAGKLIRVVVSERDITEIDNLQRSLLEQEAIKDKYRQQMMEMQQADLESRRVVVKSPCMLNAFGQAMKVARANSSVLLLGESGVGKGLFAEIIHQNSGRSEKPLIRINCGAIPESLIESELFGYEKGAFTGAQSSRPGYLALADKGTLFLDEISELPLSSQVKLLRFLEDGRILPLGGTRSSTIDVRILAATNRNLEEMVKKGLFRLDLYYRLKVIPIHIPAVRERRDCILPLVQHYIDHFGAQSNLRKRLTRAASDALIAYSYPGNVRELMNICERLVVMTETEAIDLKDLPGDVLCGPLAGGQQVHGWPEEMTLQQIQESVERGVLQEKKERYGNQCMIATALGIDQSTVARKLKKHGIV